MNENIDLTKILKDCPKGWKFYTTVWGEAEFVSIDEKFDYPIRIKERYGTRVLKGNGRWSSAINAECIIFPSKNQRDWSKFTAPWYKQEELVELKESDDEKIRRWIIDDIRYNMNNEPLNNSEYKKKAEKAIAWLEKQGKEDPSQTNDRAWLYLVSDVLTWKCGVGQYIDNPRVQELAKRLCSEYAQKPYNPSVLSNSSNTGKNEQKFDPKTLRAFDKVLVKLSNDDVWDADFFSHYNPLEKCMKYVCVANLAVFCIPYNDETKHLVGTTEEAPEFYRYWED